MSKPEAEHTDEVPKKQRGWFRRWLALVFGGDNEFAKTEAEIKRKQRELQEKNARGCRRTEGRIITVGAKLHREAIEDEFEVKISAASRHREQNSPHRSHNGVNTPLCSILRSQVP